MRFCTATKKAGKGTGGEKKRKNKWITGVTGWSERWKRAKRENANDCVGERWRIGDGVEQLYSAVIKMTCCGGEGGGGGGGIWRHFILSIVSAWEIFASKIPHSCSPRADTQNTTHLLIFNFKEASLAHLLQCHCQAPQGWRSEIVYRAGRIRASGINALRTILFTVRNHMQGWPFWGGYCNFLPVSFLFFHLHVLELSLCYIRESFISCHEMKNNFCKHAALCHLYCVYLLLSLSHTHIFTLSPLMIFAVSQFETGFHGDFVWFTRLTHILAHLRTPQSH